MRTVTATAPIVRTIRHRHRLFLTLPCLLPCNKIVFRLSSFVSFSSRLSSLLLLVSPLSSLVSRLSSLFFLSSVVSLHSIIVFRSIILSTLPVSCMSGSTDFSSQLTCTLCNRVLCNAVVLTGCMHRFCQGCVEDYFVSTASGGCPRCGKAVVGQGGCRVDALCDSIILEMGLRQCEAVELRGGHSGRRSEKNPGSLSRENRTSRMFDSCFGAEGARTALEKAMNRVHSPNNGVQKTETKNGSVEMAKRRRALRALRPQYFFLPLKFAGERDTSKEPWTYAAIPRKATTADLKRAIWGFSSS
jgi:DUF971 family protein